MRNKLLALLLCLVAASPCCAQRVIKQSTTYPLMVFMSDSADHITGKTSLTLTITASKAGAAFASISPTVTERGSGWYNIDLTTTHTNTIGDLSLHITASGADAVDMVVQVRSLVLGDDQPVNASSVRTATGQSSANMDTNFARNSPAIATGTIASVAGATEVGVTFDKGATTALSFAGCTVIFYDVSADAFVDATVTGWDGSALTFTSTGASYSPAISDTFRILPATNINVAKWLGTAPPSPQIAGVPTVRIDKSRMDLPRIGGQPGLLTPVQPFLFDSFTQASQVALNAHTGELGATWTRHGSYTSGDAQVVGGKLFSNTGAQASIYYATADPDSSANQYVEAIVRVNSLLATTQAGVIGRVDTGSGTFYSAHYDVDNACWRIIKVVSAGGTTLASWSQTLEVGRDYHLRLEVYGNAIRLLVDGTPRIEIRDTAITAAGRSGIRLYPAASTTTGFNLLGIRAGVIKPAQLALCLGDSITQNTNLGSSHQAWPNKMNLGSEWYTPHISVDGQSLQTMLGNISEATALITDNYLRERVVVVFAGTNDMYSGGRTPAQVLADAQSYGNAIRGAGGKFIFVTPLPRDNGTFNTNRATLVAAVRSSWKNWADAVVIMSDDQVMGGDDQATDEDYYQVDHVHPTAAGEARIAYHVQAAIEAVTMPRAIASLRSKKAGQIEDTFGGQFVDSASGLAAISDAAGAAQVAAESAAGDANNAAAYSNSNYTILNSGTYGNAALKTLVDAIKAVSDQFEFTGGKVEAVADVELSPENIEDIAETVAEAVGSSSVSPFIVDDNHMWHFTKRDQLTSPEIMVESKSPAIVKAMDFSAVLPEGSSIGTITSVTVADVSGATEPTITSSAVSADKQHVNIVINAASATATTYTFKFTIVTPDSQTFIRYGQLTIQ